MENKQKSTAAIDQTLAQFIDAGIGLAMLPFSIFQQSFDSTKGKTSAKFEELQARGEQVESELREKFDPLGQSVSFANICNQVSLMLSPRANKEAKIEALSKKVDTLVELVATIAAKKAAEAAAAKTADEKPKAAPKTTRRRASTSTTKAAATKTTTTRKRTTTKRATATKASSEKKES